MNLQFYKEKLEENKIFKDFKIRNPQAYLSSAFFTITITEKTQATQAQLDYFNQDKFMVFILNNEIKSKEEKAAKKSSPEKLTTSNLDITKLQEITENLLKDNEIEEKVIKIIAIVSQQDNKVTWSLNCITAAMSVIKIKLNDEGGKLAFEKLNLFDFIKKS